MSGAPVTTSVPLGWPPWAVVKTIRIGNLTTPVSLWLTVNWNIERERNREMNMRANLSHQWEVSTK